jgi:transketolase
MAAVLNGLSLHGGFRVFGSTFAVFSDYLRPAVRLSALMRRPVVYVLSHDSVAVGEDGPTHQPVEQLEALRLIPGVKVLRPADDLETITAWACALEYRDGPTVLALSRQALPALIDRGPADDPRLRVVHQGSPQRRALDVDFLATGSEVALAIAAAELLREHGVACRVRSVLERRVLVGRAREAALTVSVEAGVTDGWYRFADLCLGVDRFGICGPGPEVLRVLDLSAEAVAARVLNHLSDLSAAATA